MPSVNQLRSRLVKKLSGLFQSIRADFDFNAIYVNGSDNLLLLRGKGETWEVRLTEAEFMKRMWDTKVA